MPTPDKGAMARCGCFGGENLLIIELDQVGESAALFVSSPDLGPREE
ncbi:hypothetical protein [Microbacterium allomyrinae]|uniref:Uncharacterized protein n=1 Tax=Microbacterium allomyrinae TaxID=2830666 RepID=A0A9X1LVV6_9MICO|nr:hypothetical protein [Microbacterium allomyrinae]MCC2032661.1 hypothetical protein [Microbacterium allomyrinae]